MKRFEYKTFNTSLPTPVTKDERYRKKLYEQHDNITKRLDALGVEGWELVNVICDGFNDREYIFKREIKENE